MSLLRALQQAGVLRTLDDALANTLRRLDPSTPDDVLAAAALASLAIAQGHAGFDPAQPRLLVDADLPWPDADAWLQQLAASRFVATPASPIVEAMAAPRTVGLTPRHRFAPALPSFSRLCSSLPTSPMVARQSAGTLRISPERRRSIA